MSYPEIKALPMNTFLDGFSRLDMNIRTLPKGICRGDGGTSLLLGWLSGTGISGGCEDGNSLPTGSRERLQHRSGVRRHEG